MRKVDTWLESTREYALQRRDREEHRHETLSTNGCAINNNLKTKVYCFYCLTQRNSFHNNSLHVTDITLINCDNLQCLLSD